MLRLRAVELLLFKGEVSWVRAWKVMLEKLGSALRTQLVLLYTDNYENI